MSIPERVLWTLAVVLFMALAVSVMSPAKAHETACREDTARAQAEIQERYAPIVISMGATTTTGDHIGIGVKANGWWYLYRMTRDGGEFCLMFEGARWLLVAPVFRE